MTVHLDHNKLLKQIVKERLKAFGILQKGQSRIFLYDKGWYTIVIEFQPSSWSKGTYLNIGVDLNFYPRNYFAFGCHYREKEFQEFKDEKQFREIINLLCDSAIKKVQHLETAFQDIWIALKTKDKETISDDWNLFDIAILNALTQNTNKAKLQLEKICAKKCEQDYEFERLKLAAEIATWLDNDPLFLTKIKSLINQTRLLKKLPLVHLEDLQQRKQFLPLKAG